MSNLRTTVQTAPLLKTKAWAEALRLQAPSLAYLDGQHCVKHRGNGMEYFDNRPYQSGDDIRHIDWRLSARHTKPYLKIFQEERQMPVKIFCDLSESLAFASQGVWKRLQAAEAAAACAWMATHQGDNVAAFIYRHKNAQTLLKHRRSENFVLQLIDKLVKFGKPDQDKKLEPELYFDQEFKITLQQFARKGQPLLLISDFSNRDFWYQQLPILAKQSQVIVINVHDSLEETLPIPGSYPLQREDKICFLSLKSRKNRLSFQDALTQKKQKWQSFCQQWQIFNIDLKTTDNLSQVLPQYFPQRHPGAIKAFQVKL